METVPYNVVSVQLHSDLRTVVRLSKTAQQLNTTTSSSTPPFSCGLLVLVSVHLSGATAVIMPSPEFLRQEGQSITGRVSTAGQVVDKVRKKKVRQKKRSVEKSSSDKDPQSQTGMFVTVEMED